MVKLNILWVMVIHMVDPVIILKLPILDPASYLSISFCRRWSNCGATKKNNSVHFTPAQNEKTLFLKTFLNIASIDHLCFLTILNKITTVSLWIQPYLLRRCLDPKGMFHRKENPWEARRVATQHGEQMLLEVGLRCLWQWQPRGTFT